MFRHGLSVAIFLFALGTVCGDMSAGEYETDAMSAGEYDDAAQPHEASTASALDLSALSTEVQGEVRAILRGEAKNTFETGDMLREKEDNDVELQGACMFDKVDAIVNEGALWEHPKETQHDVASCCAQGNKGACIQDVAEIYGLLGQIAETGTDVSRRGAHAAALLIREASKRVPAEKLHSRVLKLLKVCQVKPQECTFDQLVAHSLVQLNAVQKHRDVEDDDDATASIEDLKKLVEHLETKVQKKRTGAEGEEEKEVTKAKEGLSSVEQDLTVATTLDGMVAEIEARHTNYHFMGGMLNADAAMHFSDREKEGACLLDKANAIVFEEAHLEDIQQLRVNVAACCTGEIAEGGDFSNSAASKAACIKELQPAYSLLQEIANSNPDELGGVEWKENLDRAAHAAAYMIQAAGDRITAKKLNNPGVFLLGRCSEAPEGCTMQDLFKPISVSKKATHAKAVKKEASMLEVETTTLVLR